MIADVPPPSGVLPAVAVLIAIAALAIALIYCEAV